MKSPLMAAFVAATLVFAHNAGAQNNDRYLGVGFGNASVDQSSQFGNDDDSSSTEKVFLGFIARDAADKSGIGFEFGYIDHIDTKYAFGGSANADIDMTSLYLAAVGTIPVFESRKSRMELFCKLGLHSWDFEATGRGTLSGKDGDDGSDWFYGVGLDWGPVDRKGLTFRMEYEVFPAEPEVTVAGVTASRPCLLPPSGLGSCPPSLSEVKGDYEASLLIASLIWRF